MTTKGMRASLSDVEKKSAARILAELASSFEDKDAYLRHLEGVALIAFKDALCTVDDYNMKIQPETRSENAFGRSAAFLLVQELEIQRRLNEAVCGRELNPDAL